MVSSLKEKVKEDDLHTQQELTAFCSYVFSIASSDEILVQFSALLGVRKDSFSTEHFSCCTEIGFNLASLILQTLSAKVTRSADELFKSLENMTNDEKGKV